MPGYREFVDGEVLTAANVQDYLSKQAVMVFSDSGARNSALGATVGVGNALREGMISYLADSDTVERFDGTSWDTFGTGKIVDVKHALFTGTQTEALSSKGTAAVTDLSISHTLKSSSNLLIISAYIGAASHEDDRAAVGLVVADNGTPIAIGDAEGVRAQVGAGGVRGTGDNQNVASISQTFVYAPGDTSAHTYTVNALNVSASSRTIYINRSELDANSNARPRATSGFVIQEVKV